MLPSQSYSDRIEEACESATDPHGTENPNAMNCQRKLLDGTSCRRVAREPIQLHHITPRADGGGDEPSNVIHLCRKCHFEIHKQAGDFARWGRQGGLIGGSKGGQITAAKLVSVPNLRQFQGEAGKARFYAWLCDNHPERIPDFFPTQFSLNR